MNNKNIKCILFDADGVVIRTEMFSVQYQKEYGISNEEMLPFFVGEFQECIVGKKDLKKVLKKWLPKWKWQGTVDEFLQYWSKAEHKTDERIIESIETLRKNGVKCFLATNQEKYRISYLKQEMQFEKIFDGIFSADTIGYKKPDKEFYEYILNDLKNQHNIQANEIIFFDDDQKNVDGAKAVGINAHLYTGFDKYKKIIDKK
jgi:putative hydrolase of the HAD superfamily